jgi:hypothetical protein
MYRLFFIVLLITTACASVKSQKTTASSPVREYKEDLSAYRPKFENNENKKQPAETLPQEVVAPKNDINRFLAEKIDSVYAYNLNITSADGYRILIYTGTSSEEARTQRNYVYDVLPSEKAYTEWRSPSFRVKVGDFVDKLEAYYAYAKLVKIFPNAIVVPDKVNIVRDK